MVVLYQKQARMSSIINKTHEQIRSDFPILRRQINGFPLAYLDNAATTQKPHAVIDAVSHIYAHSYANIHRGMHTMAHEASELYESTKKRLLSFVNAKDNYSVVFTKNMTESSNLVAFSYLSTQKQPQRTIILTSGQEHHSNFLPWLRQSKAKGFAVELIPTLPNGDLDINFYRQFVSFNSDKIALIALSTASNVFGILQPIEDFASIATEHNIPLFVDGAQTIGHVPTNLEQVNPAFFAASAHKMYAPAGVGMLFIRKDLLQTMEPYILGGGTVSSVTETDYVPKDSEERFVGGTPNIEGIAGLNAAIAYLEDIGMEAVVDHEQMLVTHFQERAREFSYLRFLGDIFHKNHLGLFSFASKLHPHDIADFLDQKGIAVRAGAHCAHPLHNLAGETSSVRASFGIYTTREEIDRLFESIRDIHKQFGIT
ncbi:MAG: cysteine desulfurase [Candidatus Dojkabacteria bacterium]|nr:MAG: cysteine desulfurase [Candidatus Dojkabacteria bacterium]